MKIPKVEYSGTELQSATVTPDSVCRPHSEQQHPPDAGQTTSGTSDGASSSSKASIQTGRKPSISEPTPDPGI